MKRKAKKSARGPSTKARDAEKKSKRGAGAWPRPNAHGVYARDKATVLRFAAPPFSAEIALLQVGPRAWAAGYDFLEHGAAGGSQGAGISAKRAAPDAAAAFAEPALYFAEHRAKEKNGRPALAAYLDWCLGFVGSTGPHAARLAEIRKTLSDVVPAKPAIGSTAPYLLDPPPAYDLAAAAGTGKDAGTVARLDPAKIRLTFPNPRRIAPAAEDQAAFAESIAALGVLQSVLVRPLKGTPGEYELVAGKRRLTTLLELVKAGRRPKADTIPAAIRDLDDVGAHLAALAENESRADMHPLDVAEGYAGAVAQGVKTADIARVARRTQRWVQMRIKVATHLPPEAKAALAADKINVSQAEALAAIDDERIRVSLTKEVLKAATAYGRNDNGAYFAFTMDAKRIAEKARSALAKRKRAAEQRAAEKKGGTAKRKGASPGGVVAPKPKVYPQPDKDGRYKWPKREPWREHRGEVLVVGTVSLGVEPGKDRFANDRCVAAWYWKVGAAPEIAEPLTAEGGIHTSGHAATAAAADRAIESLLTHAAPKDPAIARAFLRDLAQFIGQNWRDRERKELMQKLDARQAALFPPAAEVSRGAAEKKAEPASSAPRALAEGPRAPDPRATQPIAAPDKSAPLAEKLQVPGVWRRLPEFKGAIVVCGQSQTPPRHPDAAKIDMPDEIVVEHGGHFCAYGFLSAVDPKAAAALGGETAKKKAA